MRQLVLLYWGCVFLMYLSQTYYPVSQQVDGPQTGKHHFMLRRADVFMIAVIVWMTCFSFLRTSYNDTGTYIAHFMDSESVADYFARNGLLAKRLLLAALKRKYPNDDFSKQEALEIKATY